MWAKVIKVSLLSILAVIAMSLFFGCCTFSAPGHKGPVTDHFDGEQFHNIDKAPEHSSWDLIKWMMNRDRGYWPDFINEETGPAPDRYIPGDSLVVTFINHSTVLIQTQGLNILTDPIWSDRPSPISFIGPKRHHNPGIRFEDLPKIDIVLVSHGHYDHLDMPTLKRLKTAFDPVFYVSLGNKDVLEAGGITKVIEMDWWDSVPAGPITIHYVPARHFSMRGLSDRNKTLWGGFVITADSSTEVGPIYFAGDTGYGIHIKQIHDKFGPMRLSLLPIGAYRPRWFMSAVHFSPSEAVKAHKVLESYRSIGIHFGTFAQADDGMFEPILDLRDAIHREKIDPGSFIVPKHGKAIPIPKIKVPVYK